MSLAPRGFRSRFPAFRTFVIAFLAMQVTASLAFAQGGRRTAPAAATPVPALAESLFANLSFRNIGPANMSGRMADVEGVPGDPSLIYTGSASGGVWKSTNAGQTWSPIFDKQPVLSIGDMANVLSHDSERLRRTMLIRSQRLGPS